MTLIDSHCHLTDAQFEADRPETLRRAFMAGVERVLTVASDREDSERVVDLVASLGDEAGVPGLWGTAGIHPHEASAAEEGDLDAIRDLVQRTRRMVAIGETGLDFFYDNSPRTVQEASFRSHLALAAELDLPVVVHSRQADEQTIRILGEWGGRVRGVLHCFAGGEDLLKTALELGWMISFTGIVTFKSYRDQRLVRMIPRDRIMVETDAPYLAPVPERGHRNEPAFVVYVVQALAAAREEAVEEVADYTTANALRFFHMNS